LSHAIAKLPYGGIDTTKRLIDLLNDSPFRTWRRLSKTAGADLREVGKLKERVCRVMLDATSERDAVHRLRARWDALHAAAANNALYLSRLPKELSQVVIIDVLADEPEGLTGYKLPDGTVLYVGEEAFGCVEPYFDPTYCHTPSAAWSSPTVPIIRAYPSLSSTHASASAEVSGTAGAEEDSPMGGLAGFVSSAIRLIDVDLRKDLCNNIVLTGGGCKSRGFHERMQSDMNRLWDERTLPYVPRINPIQPDPLVASWIGGSILGSLTAPSVCIPKRDYEEHGPAIVHQRCF